MAQDHLVHIRSFVKGIPVKISISTRHAVGGESNFPCPGELLSAALPSCLDTAIRMIAAPLRCSDKNPSRFLIGSCLKWQTRMPCARKSEGNLSAEAVLLLQKRTDCVQRIPIAYNAQMVHTVDEAVLATGSDR